MRAVLLRRLRARVRTRPLRERPPRAGPAARHETRDEQRRPEHGGRHGAAQPGRAWVERQFLVVRERAGEDERGEQRRGEQRDHGQGAVRQLAAAEDHRSRGLERHGGHGEAGDRDPDLRHRSPRKPMSAAADASRTGSPGGRKGVSARAIAPPSSATASARGRLSSAASSPTKNAGKIASSPSAAGSPRALPPRTPIRVPPTQAGYCGIVAPINSSRSKRPSPCTARAHEASTTACPSTARRSGEPCSAVAAATPIARKRAFSIVPAAMAVSASPPAASTAVAPNWAEPANTTADITTGATGPMSGSARTPKDTPGTSAARPKPIPARRPGRYGARRVTPGQVTN